MSRLPGKRLGVKIGSTPVSASGGLQLEVFVDFTCPFSKKIYDVLVKEVKPHYGHKLELIFQLVPQPWHPASCMVHESFHAACLAAPFKEEKLFAVTFRDALVHFGDSHTMESSRKKVHAQLSGIYEDCAVEKMAFLKNLALDTADGQVNGGNAASRLVKLYVKQHRQLGVHVTPTIRVNGVVCDSSSSWSLQEWRAFLDPVMDADYI